MRMKEETEKAGLKLNIKKNKIMASSPITSWQADGGNCWKMMETVRFHFSWAPKSTWTMIATMKLKDALLLGRKAVTNLDSVLKSKDITLPTKAI